MKISLGRGFKDLAERLRRVNKKTQSRSPEVPKDQPTVAQPQTLPQSSVENFYLHQVRTNLRDFERFALQSQSQEILNVFARGASHGRHSLLGLIAELQDNYRALKVDKEIEYGSFYDVNILLSLAILLTNSSRSDLDLTMGILLFEFIHDVFGLEQFSSRDALQYVEALGEAREYRVQEKLIDELDLEIQHPLQVKLLRLNRLRSEGSSAHEWLESLNELYASLGMSSLKLLSDDSLPLMDRLISDAEREITGPKISVIMPTFSPGPGIHTAIRSLLQQTWTNLEILVVDDGSSSDFDSLFAQLEAQDDRLKVIRTMENSGAYTARNIGLQAAAGEIITTHDDDDWSHPDKLATQAQALLDDSSLLATTTAHVRTTQDMHFVRINSRAVYAHKNYSSLMFRRSVIEDIGPWDTVNRGADSEFESRLSKAFGKKRRLDLVHKPMSFSRVWTGSLTSGEVRRGYQSYSRQLYHQAYSQWHNSIKKGDRPVLSVGKSRPFPVPTTFEAGFRGANLGLFDVIFAADYFSGAKHIDVVLANIKAAVNAGLRVGYMLISSPQTLGRSKIVPELFAMQFAGDITQVAHDDIAQSRLLIVYDLSVGMFLDTLRSKLSVRQGLAVYDELPRLVGKEVRDPTFVPQALYNLDRAFSCEFQVTATSLYSLEKLLATVPRKRLVENCRVWNAPLAIRSYPPVVAPNGSPVVGYHSFSNEWRWPSSLEEFRMVFQSSHYQTKFYGNLAPARKKFGSENVTFAEILSRGEITLEEFFASIDFWVYFPDSRLCDHKVWQPTLEAMQAGKVVIVPKKLKAVYEDAAVYADPWEVELTIQKFNAAPAKYSQQAWRGRRFVEEKHSQESFISRLNALMHAED